MLLKAAAIAGMVGLGLVLGGGHIHPLPLLDQPVSFGLLAAIGAAMTPVAFAYGGWQTASFVAEEMRDSRRDLSRGLLLGVGGVIALYLSANFVCLKVLGPAGLAATRTPATAVMRAAMGDRGALWIAVGIAVSTLGFLSQSILTAPRVYYAMARDGLFFSSFGQAFAAHGGAHGGDCRAGADGYRNGSVGAVRKDSQLRSSGGFHSLRTRGDVAVRLPPARARKACGGGPRSAGASVYHGAVRGGLRHDRR